MNSKKIACLLEVSSKFDVNDFGLKIGRNHMTYVATMLKNIEDLGFTFSKSLITKLALVSETDLIAIYQAIVPMLKKMKGANVRHKPMYPNFPQQVMEMDEAELYINALVHYIGVALGVNILPDTEKKERFPLIGNYKLQVIDVAPKDAYVTAINNLVGSSIALSETQKNYVREFYADNKTSFHVSEVKNKEIGAFLAGLFYADGNVSELKALMKTPTDLLRFVTALNDGDISLAENTKFKSLKRSQRKLIITLLEGMKELAVNMVRHKDKWLRLGEILHPGEFSKRFPKSYAAFTALRHGDHIETFNSKVEALLLAGKYLDCAKLLSERPTDLARRLDAILRNSKTKDRILQVFKKVAPKIPTNVLLNIKSHFTSRIKPGKTRMFFPKGSMAKVQVIENTVPAMPKAICDQISKIVSGVLVKRFADQSKLGKVFIDDALKTINVPFALRSASHAFKTIARGSRVAVPGDKKVIRLFTYWKNGLKAGVKDSEDYWDGNRIDIDLSAFFLNEKFEDAGHVSWTNLRSGYGKDVNAVHSGDITDAPKGASEFLDIDIEKTIAKGIRYVAMNVKCFTGQPFSDMNECFAGVMLRNDLGSGEIYEAKTVEHKYDLTANGQLSVPLIFDLKKRELIWLDIVISDRMNFYSRTVEGNKKSLATIVEGIVELSKPTLYDLLSLHAKGRGTIVKTRKEAKTVYDLNYAVNSVPEILTLI